MLLLINDEIIFTFFLFDRIVLLDVSHGTPSVFAPCGTILNKVYIDADSSNELFRKPNFTSYSSLSFPLFFSLFSFLSFLRVVLSSLDSADLFCVTIGARRDECSWWTYLYAPEAWHRNPSGDEVCDACCRYKAPTGIFSVELIGLYGYQAICTMQEGLRISRQSGPSKSSI